MKILVLNSGSSSQKSALFELDSSPCSAPPAPLWEAKIEWQGERANLKVHSKHGILEKQTSTKDRQSATRNMLATLWDGPSALLHSVSEMDAVGHRVVHGGPDLRSPVRITPEVKKIIARVAAFAPLHNRAELEGMEIVEQLAPSVPQIAVFDTGFHRTLPPEAACYPGPYEWVEQGIRRYGFHGINYEYCAGRAAQLLKKNLKDLKIVACHLGNGCSLVAIAGGQSVETTMGFTPLEGLMMGTRSGSVDPGILTYLMRQNSMNGNDLDDLLNRKSGLLGISGLSSDMRDIVAAMMKGNARAKLAFDIFIHRLQAGIGAMAAALNGLDVLIFTAGIGENSPEVRAAAAARLSYLGVQLDPEKNAISPTDADISCDDAPIRVLIIHAQEDFAIARACVQTLQT